MSCPTGPTAIATPARYSRMQPISTIAVQRGMRLRLLQPRRISPTRVVPSRNSPSPCQLPTATLSREQCQQQRRREPQEHRDDDDVGVIAQLPRQQEQRALQQVDHRHGLEVLEATTEQPMVQVVLVGRERRASLAQADRDHRQRVQDRQAEQQQRQRRTEGQRFVLGEEHGQHADGEAEKLAASVTHEHPGRKAVVAQEAQQATHDDDGDGRDERQVRAKAQQRKSPRSRGRSSRRPTRRARPRG